MKVLIDNGHGYDTPGKCSPDGHFREFAWNRIFADDVYQHLKYRGYDTSLLVPEGQDISLKERCRRVNKICREAGRDNVILVSIHINAAGNDGKWHLARGWSCYTSVGNTEADDLATCLCEAAVKYLPGYKMRFDHSDGDPDQEKDFYLLSHTACPAVLTENLFMDNEDDVAFLESDEGRKAITALHVEGVCNYLKHIQKNNAL